MRNLETGLGQSSEFGGREVFHPEGNVVSKKFLGTGLFNVESAAAFLGLAYLGIQGLRKIIGSTERRK